MSLPMKSDSAIIQEWECFHAKNRLEKLCVFVFHCEGKLLLTLSGKHIFHLATLSSPASLEFSNSTSEKMSPSPWKQSPFCEVKNIGLFT